MLSKSLENSTSYDIFFINFGKKLEFTTPYAFLGGGGGPGPRAPPPGFATELQFSDHYLLVPPRVAGVTGTVEFPDEYNVGQLK